MKYWIIDWIMNWIESIFVMNVVIGIINMDINPAHWSEIWQAAWLITSVQCNGYLRR